MESPIVQMLKPSPSVRESATQDGTVLLDVQHGMCFPLDPVATCIWKMIKDGLHAGDIAREIATAYDIPFEQARIDVQEFIEQLQQSRLLAPAVSTSSGRSWFKGILTRWRTRAQNMARNQ